MNNFTVPNPYTYKIPTGTVNKIQLTPPNNVTVQWPNPSGGVTPSPIKRSFWHALFG